MATTTTATCADARPHCILLGDDGSEASVTARHLVHSIAWAPSTVVHRVAAVEEPSPPAAQRVPVADRLVDEAAIVDQLSTTRSDIVRDGVVCHEALIHGWPGEVLVSAADRLRPDLVVLGGRSSGHRLTPGLGPVSSWVASHAAWPVLVVRRDDIRTILLAVEGSAAARAATDFLADSELSVLTTIHVVSVVETERPVRDAPFRDSSTVWGSAARADRAADRATHQEMVAWARSRLQGCGRVVTSETRVGNPAGEILASAAEVDADLIVLGRRQGLWTGGLGPVAEDVLRSAAASVLLVPGTHRHPTAH